ncbi:nicotinamide riboside transporter PnuC [uncultured Legionella sp.]|uniref:nicotinamide riboside transporter PnuC n=1 Tax=uncultured Legionella sp. TaxID=210934 RepID=UPI002630096A|nr:nicotinamide riboside transporter PnuC [uncultured Legionella sp.]
MLLDLTGSLASLLSTYYFIRLNNKAWPIGMIATVLNGWLYWQKGIYADTALEFIYFLSMCYGWFRWYRQDTVHNSSIPPPIGQLNKQQWIVLGFSLITMFLFIAYLLRTFTHSTVPFLDAATTSMSLVAQWLMCHKIIATWFLWFITDALYAILYFSKTLPFHSILMLIYTGLAITGYMVWAKKSKPASLGLLASSQAL